MARPNIRQIEAFNAVVKGGSVTRAAELLFVSQPAVSKLVQQFESSCGFPLFNRTQGRLQPTPEARRLFSETEKFMTGVERIENAARAIRETERGEITVAAFPALGLRVLPQLIGPFLRDRPEVNVTLLTQNSPEISQTMLSRAADFGISLIPTQAPGIVCRPFVDVQMVCALPADHPLSMLDEIELRALDGEQMILLGRDDQSKRVILDALSHAGARVEYRAEVQMADTACVLVSQGFGFSIVPSLATMGWMGRGVRFVPIRPVPHMTVWLYANAWEPMSNLAQMLVDSLRQELISETSFSIGLPRQ